MIVLLLKEINGIFAFQRYTKNAYSNGAPHAGIRYGCLFCFSRIKNVYLNCSDDNPSVNKNLFHLTPPAVKYEAYIIRKTHFLNLPNLVLENKKCIFALLRFQSMLYLSVAGARHLFLYI